MEIIHLDSVGSTNDFLLQLVAKFPQWEGAVVSKFQTEGKGMGTNRWESEAGKNLLYSVVVRPSFLQASQQYLVSMVQAIAIHEALSRYSEDITIKWPNDIYWRDKKISGTRIDSCIHGSRITDFIIGTGINLNQTEFRSEAPNPVSLSLITGDTYNVDNIADEVLRELQIFYNKLKAGEAADIISTYHDRLYRREGVHAYRDESHGEFLASIVCVRPNGRLVLLTEDGTEREYDVKEVQFV